ncbi:MAG: hypothetical protein J7513_02565 [Solirubrobacteraceae bacterium]|nr:hypothetical protein [Solirubrobacteraceae bacterium]
MADEFEHGYTFGCSEHIVRDALRSFPCAKRIKTGSCEYAGLFLPFFATEEGAREGAADDLRSRGERAIGLGEERWLAPIAVRRSAILGLAENTGSAEPAELAFRELTEGTGEDESTWRIIKAQSSRGVLLRTDPPRIFVFLDGVAEAIYLGLAERVRE